MAEEEIMEKKFVKVGQLKPGNYVLIDGFVCQIRDIEKSKPGKHGAAKCRITAFDVFTSQKRGLLKPSTADTDVPIIKRGSAQVVAVMGDNIQIMDLGNYDMFLSPRPKDIAGLASGAEIEYIKYGKNVKILRKKSST